MSYSYSYSPIKSKKYGLGGLIGTALGAAIPIPGASMVLGAVGTGIDGAIAKNKSRKLHRRKQAALDAQFAMDSQMGGNLGNFAYGGFSGVPGNEDAVAFEGPSHAQGGIMLNPQAEVEGGETMDKVDGQQFIFSKRIAVPGKKTSFADEHKNIKKKSGGKLEVKTLARMQENEKAKLGVDMKNYGYAKMQYGGSVPPAGEFSLFDRTANAGLRGIEALRKAVGSTAGKTPVQSPFYQVGDRIKGRFAPKGSLKNFLPKGYQMPRVGVNPITTGAFAGFGVGNFLGEKMYGENLPQSVVRYLENNKKLAVAKEGAEAAQSSTNDLRQRQTSSQARVGEPVAPEFIVDPFNSAPAYQYSLRTNIPGSVDSTPAITTQPTVVPTTQSASPAGQVVQPSSSSSVNRGVTEFVDGINANLLPPDVDAKSMAKQAYGILSTPAESRVNQVADYRQRPSIEKAKLPGESTDYLGSKESIRNKVATPVNTGKVAKNRDYKQLLQFAPELASAAIAAFAPDSTPTPVQMKRATVKADPTGYNINPLLTSNAASYRAITASPGMSANAMLMAQGQKQQADATAYATKANMDMQNRLSRDTTQAGIDSSVNAANANFNNQYREDKMMVQGNRVNSVLQSLAGISTKQLQMRSEQKKIEMYERLMEDMKEYYGS